MTKERTPVNETSFSECRNTMGRRESHAPSFMCRTFLKRVRERLHRQYASGLLALSVVMLCASFGSLAFADIYITGVDNGTTTVYSFVGSLEVDSRPVGGSRGTLGTDIFFGSTLFMFPNPSVAQNHSIGEITPRLALSGWHAPGAEFSVDSSTHSGDVFGLGEGNSVQLPAGYVSGTKIMGTTTFIATGLPIDLSTPITFTIAGSTSKIYLNQSPPEPILRIAAPRRSFRFRNRLTVRGRSTQPLSSLQAKWTGRSGFKTIQLRGASSWRVQVPRSILRKKRAVTVIVRGINASGQTSSIVKRKYRRRASPSNFGFWNPLSRQQ